MSAGSPFKLLRRGGRIKHEVVLFAFDVLKLDGVDLRSRPLEKRKRAHRGAPMGGQAVVTACRAFGAGRRSMRMPVRSALKASCQSD
jgi:hypothetical protein